jgi:hypothetical protein
MAASTARASHNPDGPPRGIYKPEEFHRLAKRLPIPPHLQRTFPLWYEACGNRTGETIEFFVAMEKFARKAMICERTARSHVRKFEQLELVRMVSNKNSAHRPKTHRLNIARLYQQDWAACPRCGHKHENGHCGHSLDSRRVVFRVGRGKEKKRSEKIVERTCRCAAAVQHTPVLVNAEVAKPAGSAPSEHRSSARQQQPKLNKLETAKFAAQMKSLIEGRTKHVEEIGGYGFDLGPGDPRYRAPMQWREALDTLAKLWKRGPDVVFEALKFWGYKFEESEGP